MNMKNQNIVAILAGAMTVFGLGSCKELTPDVFEDINGVYFNNRTNTNILQDTTSVTFVYRKGDEMPVPVVIQLVGRPSGQAREIALSVSSEDAREGVDYILPGKAELPAGETTFEYVITLKRTPDLKSRQKHVQVSLQPNDHFALPVTKETTANGDEVSTLSYRIAFSDQFTTAPKAWKAGLLGVFTQQKFELACKVLDLDPADFNDESKMTLAMQSYVSAQMQGYVKEQQKLRDNGEAYDTDAFDAQGVALLFSGE